VNNMLTVKNLNQLYGQSHILWDLDLEIEKGKCTCLMGRNGVGKTTLLKCLMGELPLSSGSMVLQVENGKEVDLASQVMEQRSRLGIGYVPQGRQIFPLLTVEENLKIGLGARNDGVKKVPDFIFELFPVLKEMLERRGGDLSGGQQPQLAIVGALVLNLHLLILAEPTAGIPPSIVTEIGGIVRKLNEGLGLTVLLVEQKLPFVRRVAYNFYIVDRGRNQASGAINDLNEDLVKQYLTV